MFRLILIIGILSFSLLSVSAIDYNDGVPILKEGAEPTEAQENAIRKGARNWCSDRPDEEREQCEVDYFIAHNYQGDPSCD
jgi:hypothetical protein